MQTVSVHEAKTHLSRLLKQVKAGEEIVITHSGTPVARLSAIGAARRVKIGDLAHLAHEIHIPNNFDDPIPEEWFGHEDKFDDIAALLANPNLK